MPFGSFLCPEKQSNGCGSGAKNIKPHPIRGKWTRFWKTIPVLFLALTILLFDLFASLVDSRVVYGTNLILLNVKFGRLTTNCYYLDSFLQVTIPLREMRQHWQHPVVFDKTNHSTCGKWQKLIQSFVRGRWMEMAIFRKCFFLVILLIRFFKSLQKLEELGTEVLCKYDSTNKLSKPLVLRSVSSKNTLLAWPCFQRLFWSKVDYKLAVLAFATLLSVCNDDFVNTRLNTQSLPKSSTVARKFLLERFLSVFRQLLHIKATSGTEALTQQDSKYLIKTKAKSFQPCCQNRWLM